MQILLIFVTLIFLNMNAYADDLCPEIDKVDSFGQGAYGSLGNDLAGVQADIDRFSLCVERAQLLKRLNDLSLDNRSSLFGPAPNDIGDIDAPPPTLGNQPEMQDFRMLTPQDVLGLQPEPEVAVQDFQEDPLNIPQDLEGDWGIRDMMGSGSNLTARLVKADGTVLQVRAGDVLTDGSQVQKISLNEVLIMKDGEIQTLAWAKN